MKLFTVTASFDYVIVAESEKDAHRISRQQVREAFNDLSRDDIELDVTPGASAAGWDDECLPFGGDGKTSTGEYRKMQNVV